MHQNDTDATVATYATADDDMEANARELHPLLAACEERAIASDSDASGKAATALTHSHDAHLSDMVIEFATLAGVSAARVEAIARGEETTRGELDDLGHGFVEWIRGVAKKG